MTEKTIYVCDGCGDKVDDFYASPGWVQIEGHVGDFTITIATQRRTTLDSAITGYHKAKLLHFCSPRCLTGWLDKIYCKAFKDEQEYQCKNQRWLR